MEALGIAASVIAVLGATGKVGKGLEKLVALRDASGHLYALFNEVSDLRVLLSTIDDLIREQQIVDGSERDNGLLQSLGQQVRRTGDLVQELDELIHYRLLQPGSSHEVKVSRQAWLSEQSKLIRLRKAVRRSRQDLTTTLTAINTSASSRLILDIQELTLIARNTNAPLGSLERISRQFEQNTTAIDQLPTRMTAPFNDLNEIKLILQTMHENSQRSPAALADNQRIIRESQSIQARPTWNVAMSDSQIEADDAIRISTSLHHDAVCDRWCSCRCHTVTNLRTPMWLRKAIGLLFVGYLGIPYLSHRSCSERSCRRSVITQTRVSYYFPSWLLSRNLQFVGRWRTLEGPELLLRVPRVVPYDSRIITDTMKGNLAGIKDLFAQRSASPFDVSSNSGESVLQLAVLFKHMETVRFLLCHNADPYMQNDNASSANDYAWDEILRGIGNKTTRRELECMFRDPELLERRRFSPLHKVVLGFSSTTLEMELQLSTSEIDSGDSKGRTPILWAAARGDCDAVKMLIRYRANIHLADTKGMQPLHWATRVKSPSCLRLLLLAGAVAASRDDLGESPLDHACLQGDKPGHLEVLIDYGSDVNARASTGAYPLHYAMTCDSPRNLEVLSRRGAQFDVTDYRGYDAPTYAVSGNRHKVLSFLLERGFALNSRTFDQSTILHYAAKDADIKTMEILISANLRGIDVHGTSRGANAHDLFKIRLSTEWQRGEAYRSELRAAWLLLWEEALRQNSGRERLQEITSDDESDASGDDENGQGEFLDAVETQETSS